MTSAELIVLCAEIRLEKPQGLFARNLALST
jgi:hypothetical protein